MGENRALHEFTSAEDVDRNDHHGRSGEQAEPRRPLRTVVMHNGKWWVAHLHHRPHPTKEGHPKELVESVAKQISYPNEMLKPMCPSSKEGHAILQHFRLNKLTGSENLYKLLRTVRDSSHQSSQMLLTAGRGMCTTEEQIYHGLVTICWLALWAKYLQDAENNSQPNWSRNYLLSLGWQNAPGKKQQ